MRWKPKPGQSVRTVFPLLRPIILDDGTRILWEALYERTTIYNEWGGMGADGCDGYTEYFDLNWNPLGKRSFRT